MKNSKEIVIIIDEATGETQIEAKGYKGKGCVEATAFIEKALGKPAKRTKKKDYHKDAKDRRTVQARG